MTKRSTKDKIDLLINISPSFAPLLTANQGWVNVGIAALGVFAIWGEVRQNKISELVEYINEHREEFISEIIESEKFKTIFVGIFEQYMKENMEEKRKILRNYLLNTGKGIEREFKYHTKFLSTIQQITLDELKVLNIWEGGLQSENSGRKIKDFNLTQIQFAFKGKSWQPTDEELEFILKSLGSYGLIDLREIPAPTLAGSVYRIIVKDISTYGRQFLKFIKNPE